MKDIPLPIKIVAVVVVLLFFVMMAYFFIASKNNSKGDSSTDPIAFVDPFPVPLPPRPPSLYPTAVLSVDSTIVPYGGKAVLSWSSSNAVSCTALDGWEGKQATSGTLSTGALTSARTYDIKCDGAAGESSVQSVTVNVIPIPTGTLSANPNPVPYGGNSTLTWSSSDETDECVASGAWSGTKKIFGTETENGLTSSRTYVLKCTGRGGSNLSSVEVKVIPLPRGNFYADTNPVPYRGTTTLSWASSDATSCIGLGAWSGVKGVSGSQSIGPLTSPKTYILKCSGRGGIASKSLTVNVLALPKGTFVAEPSFVPYNGTAVLSWSMSGNVTSCMASGGWSGAKAPSGSESVGPLVAQQKYALTCTGPAGDSIPQTVTIKVGGRIFAGGDNNGGNPVGGNSTTEPNGGEIKPDKPTEEFVAQPEAVPYGTSPTLVWSSVATDACVASGTDSSWKGAKEISGTETPNPIKRATTYTLRCSGRGGSVLKSITVNVIALPTTGILRVDPNPVPHGERTNITWYASKDATSCMASGGWSGTKSIGGTEIIGPFDATQVMTLTCSGPGGQSTPQSTTVKVLPRGDFWAEASEIVAGTKPTLHWKMEGATQCVASGGWTGAKTPDGHESVDPIIRPTSNKSYTLRCTGPGGTKTSTVAVKLILLPTNSFSSSLSVVPYQTAGMVNASPTDDLKGVTLTWSPSPDVTVCTASGGWSGEKSLAQGSTEVIRELTKTQKYTLTCNGHGGEVVKSVTIKVKPFVDLTLVNPPSRLVTASSNTYEIPLNGAPILRWSVANADSCQPSGWNSDQKLRPDEWITPAKTVDAVSVTTNYRLTCANADGEVTKSVILTIKAPTLSLSADSLSIPYNGGTTLRWSVTDATSCSASNGWSGEKSVSGGTENTAIIQKNHTYKLTCVGSGGRTVTETVEVKVRPKVWLRIRTRDTDNADVDFEWQSWNATSCSAKGEKLELNKSGNSTNWDGNKPLSDKEIKVGYSGSHGAKNVSSMRYTLSCTGSGGTTDAVLDVSWTGDSVPFEVTR